MIEMTWDTKLRFKGSLSHLKLCIRVKVAKPKELPADVHPVNSGETLTDICCARVTYANFRCLRHSCCPKKENNFCVISTSFRLVKHHPEAEPEHKREASVCIAEQEHELVFHLMSEASYNRA